MALSDRKKKGIGFFVGGAAFIAAGVVFFLATTTPDWLATVFQVVGAIGAILGYTFVFPDIQD
jgi:hypothetical protein